jgi:hypothetical protein
MPPPPSASPPPCNFSWRWILYINIPVGGATLVYLMATLHAPAYRVGHKT